MLPVPSSASMWRSIRAVAPWVKHEPSRSRRLCYPAVSLALPPNEEGAPRQADVDIHQIEVSMQSLCREAVC